jgi:hypothetical protein
MNENTFMARITARKDSMMANTLDNQVLLDAARMLGTAQRIIKQLVKTTACTEYYEERLITEATANIHAALVRLQK